MALRQHDPAKYHAHLREIQRTLKGAFGQTLLANEPQGDELFVSVKPASIADIMPFLHDDETCRFDYIRCLCGVDYPDNVTVVYHLFSTSSAAKITVKACVPKTKPSIASVTNIWAGADWHERETAEMFGLTFVGHPDPRKLLLTDDNDTFPLRKEFKLDYGDGRLKNGDRKTEITEPETRG